jgi:hypothetical protein
VLFSGNSARADGAGGSTDEKKISVGGDLQFMLPLSSDFSNASGPWIGALAHAGYRVIPPLEITARIGYLAGLSKSQQTPFGSVSYSVSDIPIWLGARYYFMDAPAGLYGAAELGINVMNVSAGGQSTGWTREGFNIGAGYVISKELPIDIRAQLMYLNLLGTQSGESGWLGLGLSVGYSFFL